MSEFQEIIKFNYKCPKGTVDESNKCGEQKFINDSDDLQQLKERRDYLLDFGKPDKETVDEYHALTKRIEQIEKSGQKSRKPISKSSAKKEPKTISTPSNYNSQPTIDAIISEASKLGINVTIKYVKTKEMIPVLNQSVKIIADYKIEFPIIRTSGILVDPIRNNAYMQSFGPNTALSGIRINSDWINNPKKLDKVLSNDVKNGFHPTGCNTIKSIIDHEMAHQLTDYYNILNDKEFLSLYNSLSSTDIRKGLSSYALKNKYEFISEAWAEFRNNSNPRPIALKVGNIIMKRAGKI